ncbi:MAG: hypothetical protein ABH828_06330 [archaeon]
MKKQTKQKVIAGSVIAGLLVALGVGRYYAHKWTLNYFSNLVNNIASIDAIDDSTNPNAEADIQFNIGTEVMNYIKKHNLEETDIAEYSKHINNALDRFKEAHNISPNVKTANTIIQTLLEKGDYNAALDSMKTNDQAGGFFGAYSPKDELKAYQLKMADHKPLSSDEKTNYRFILAELFKGNPKQIKSQLEILMGSVFEGSDGNLRSQFTETEMNNMEFYLTTEK